MCCSISRVERSQLGVSVWVPLLNMGPELFGKGVKCVLQLLWLFNRFGCDETGGVVALLAGCEEAANGWLSWENDWLILGWLGLGSWLSKSIGALEGKKLGSICESSSVRSSHWDSGLKSLKGSACGSWVAAGVWIDAAGVRLAGRPLIQTPAFSRSSTARSYSWL